MRAADLGSRQQHSASACAAACTPRVNTNPVASTQPPPTLTWSLPHSLRPCRHPCPQERDIISLYRLLYSYSVGFFTDVQGLLDRTLGAAAGGGGAGGPELRQDLLEAVFRAYAQLWDEALMVGGGGLVDKGGRVGV